MSRRRRHAAFVLLVKNVAVEIADLALEKGLTDPQRATLRWISQIVFSASELLKITLRGAT